MEKKAKYPWQKKDVDFTLEEMVSAFDNFTQEKLTKLSWLLHDGDIPTVIQDMYLACISQIISAYHAVRTKEIEYDRFGHSQELGMSREMAQSVKVMSEKQIELLQKEKDLALQVIYAFKKIRWKLDAELKGDASQAPKLKEPRYHYVKELYEALVAVFHYHKSEVPPPFEFKPDGTLNEERSNSLREVCLYKSVETLLITFLPPGSKKEQLVRQQFMDYWKAVLSPSKRTIIIGSSYYRQLKYSIFENLNKIYHEILK